MDVVCVQMFCTIQKAGSLIAWMVTKSHKRTHISHNTCTLTRTCTKAWMRCMCSLSSLAPFISGWSVMKIPSRPAESVCSTLLSLRLSVVSFCDRGDDAVDPFVPLTYCVLHTFHLNTPWFPTLLNTVSEYTRFVISTNPFCVFWHIYCVLLLTNVILLLHRFFFCLYSEAWSALCKLTVRVTPALMWAGAKIPFGSLCHTCKDGQPPQHTLQCPTTEPVAVLLPGFAARRFKPTSLTHQQNCRAFRRVSFLTSGLWQRLLLTPDFALSETSDVRAEDTLGLSALLHIITTLWNL